MTGDSRSARLRMLGSEEATVRGEEMLGDVFEALEALRAEVER